MKQYAQLTLDGMDAPTAKIIAINQVERNADPSWLHAAALVIRALCRTQLYWSSDDVWAGLDILDVEAPHEPRAMGAAIRQAARLGLCEASGRYVASTRVECHARPLALWRSKR